MSYLAASQAADGSWIPLWFGNEKMPGHVNPTYGTSRVVAALNDPAMRDAPQVAAARQRGIAWLLQAQNADGGWGGGATPSSIEETGVAVQALAGAGSPDAKQAIVRAVRWMIAETNEGHDTPPTPIGLYFARLWYYEELYPLIFALAALSRARTALNAGIGD
jgi:squalene-hopene/tetraprenyl-beta-curcumene cyclase